MFWTLSKEGTPGAFKTMKALSEDTGLNYDTLRYQFGRMKRERYETDEIRIEKIELK